MVGTVDAAYKTQSHLERFGRNIQMRIKNY